MKKCSNKKGIAIITSLGVCFVLLALGTVLMINSYAHMSMAQRYYYAAESLNIAEGGINWEIHELEKKQKFHEITASDPPNPETINLGRGHFVVSRYNNMTGASDVSWEGLTIPPYYIGIKSTGTIRAGGQDYTKTVKTIVSYQLIPYTVSSEGTIKMNVGCEETATMDDPFGYNPADPTGPAKSELKSFTALIGAIDGFTGNIHSNYTGEPTYRCTTDPNIYVHLTVNGGTMSSSGKVGTEAANKINSHGGTAASNVSKKEFFDTDYSKLYNKANDKSKFISLDDKVPSIADFLGEMKKDGSKLKGHVEILGITMWVNIEDVPLYGNCLPPGTKWEPGTGTLVIEENKNFKWNGNLKLTDVNIRVEGNKGSGLFVNGNITADNIEITADAFSLASNNKDITLNNASLNITAPVESDGVALYTKNLTITTNPSKVPAGGNKFKGILYSNDGIIDVTNQYTGTTDNNMLLEGLIVNTATNPDNAGLKVKNKGSSDFKVELRYNPYVSNPLIDYVNGSVNLQPVYWQID
jgi:hypothetical protein